MKILRIVGIAIILLFIGALVLLPSNLDVKVEKNINTPLETVYYQVVLIPNWLKWSPWELSDSTRLFDFKQGDSETLIGGKGEWTTLLPNSSDGRYEVVDAKKNEYVVVDVYIYKVSKEYRSYQFKFNFENVVGETGNPQTKVTWTMTDTAGFFKIQERIQVPALIESFTKHFEEGLSNLEIFAHEQEIFHRFQRVDISPNMMNYFIYSEVEIEPNISAIEKSFNKLAKPVFDFATKEKIQFREPPVIKFSKLDFKNNKAIAQFGFGINPEQKVKLEKILPNNMKIVDVASPLLVNATIIMPKESIEYFSQNLLEYVKLKKFKLIGDMMIRIMYNVDDPNMPKHFVMTYPVLPPEK